MCKDNTELAIRMGKEFLDEINIEFEEPITASNAKRAIYRVSFFHKGASDPNIVIDPPHVMVEVDIISKKVELLPAM